MGAFGVRQGPSQGASAALPFCYRICYRTERISAHLSASQGTKTRFQADSRLPQLLFHRPQKPGGCRFESCRPCGLGSETTAGPGASRCGTIVPPPDSTCACSRKEKCARKRHREQARSVTGSTAKLPPSGGRSSNQARVRPSTQLEELVVVPGRFASDAGPIVGAREAQLRRCCSRSRGCPGRLRGWCGRLRGRPAPAAPRSRSTGSRSR
jgi:hypothetical protein